TGANTRKRDTNELCAAPCSTKTSWERSGGSQASTPASSIANPPAQQTQKSSPAEAGAANSGYGACRLAIMCKSVAVSHVHSYARCVAVGTPTPPRGASAVAPEATVCELCWPRAPNFLNCGLRSMMCQVQERVTMPQTNVPRYARNMS